MPEHSDKQRIESLLKQLADANKRAEKAEAKAKSASRNLDAAKKKLEQQDAAMRRYDKLADIREKILPDLLQNLKMVVDYIATQHVDIPEVKVDLLQSMLQDFADTMNGALQFEAIPTATGKSRSRLAKTGSEKIPATTKKFATQGMVAASAATQIGDAQKAIQKGAGLLQDALKKLFKSSENTNQAINLEDGLEEAIAACKDITDIAGIEDAKAKPEYHGRGALVGVHDADAAAPMQVSKCPVCGSTDLEVSKEFSSKIRALEQSVHNLSTIMVGQSEHVHCKQCHTVFLNVADDAIPISPGKSISQRIVTTVGVMNTKGIPLARSTNLIFGKDSQIGHATIGSQVHEWAMFQGRLLMDQITKELQRQQVLLMDETPIRILQKQGLGPCKALPESERKSCNYLAVQCSAPYEEHHVRRFQLLESRSKNAINKSLEGMQSTVLVTDAYAGYKSNKSEDNEGTTAPSVHSMNRQTCCVHLRRQVWQALDLVDWKSALSADDSSKALEILKKNIHVNPAVPMLASVVLAFSKIYKHEKNVTRNDGEALDSFLSRVQKNRDQYARPLMDDIDKVMLYLATKYCRETRVGSYASKEANNAFGVAVSYYMNDRDHFRTFLTDPMVPPDTNTAESTIRAIAVLRKVTDFKQSVDRTLSMCIWFSLNATAQANKISNTVKWLEEYGCALYRHMAQKALTERYAAGEGIDAKLDKFESRHADDFDFEPWLPWNYVKRQDQN